MSSAFTVARLAGIQVRIHWSWGIAFELITRTPAASVLPDRLHQCFENAVPPTLPRSDGRSATDLPRTVAAAPHA